MDSVQNISFFIDRTFPTEKIFFFYFPSLAKEKNDKSVQKWKWKWVGSKNKKKKNKKKK